MDLTAQFKNNRIIPEYDSDYENLKKLKPDTTYKVTIVQPRNLGFHRKFFSLLNLCFDNQETFDDIKRLRKWLTIKSGFYEEYRTPEGLEIDAKSISFSNMDDLEFQEFYSKFLDQVLKFLNISNQEIQSELVNYM